MTQPASDELVSLIAMAAGMGDLARQGGASGYAVSGMFERLIARIRSQDAEIKRLTNALEIAAQKIDMTADWVEIEMPNLIATINGIRSDARAARAALKGGDA